MANIIVMKRNGEKVPYNAEKIRSAIAKALTETEEVTVKRMSKVAQEIGGMVGQKILEERKGRNGEISISVERIQDIVETELMRAGFPSTAKAYILYRSQHKKVREMKNAVLDVKKTIEDYVGNDKDWRVKENATVSLSLGGLILYNSGTITANYWLSEIYGERIAEAHRNADIHLHDLSMLSGYCAGWSLKQLILEGFGGVAGRIASSPACHLSTLCNQMVNFIGTMQNEWAGAQAFSSFDTYLAPFVRVDKLNYKETKQCIQSFVYGVNIPSRWGTQAPFTNITLDWLVPEDMIKMPAIVGGTIQEFTYGDCQPEMDMINKAFIEIMIEGDANGRGFQYPIPTYSITKNFDWSDIENNRLLFEMAAKFGTPYFSNYINSDMNPGDVRSMCCRLRLDLRELRRKAGGFFGAGESTGSIGVVTLNLPRIGYLSESEDDFYVRLDNLMDIAACSLDIKRKFITRQLSAGLYPYTKKYLGHFDNHFSTIGLVGMNEAARNAKWLQTNLASPKGQQFAKEVLQHMRERIRGYQEQYKALFNLEATPAESAAYRLAKHDVERYPDIITATEKGNAPFYTNSSHLPVGYTEDVFEALDLQDDLQTLYTSGTVFHVFLGERLPDWRSAASLVRKIAENYRLPYYTISPTYSICAQHGYINGETAVCPFCGNITETYSRITGYYRPLCNWNGGKVEEFRNRKEYRTGEGKNFFDSKVEGKIHSSEYCEKTVDAINNLNSITLFSTRTCSNCKMVKTMLDQSKIAYDVIYADEQPEMAAAFGVMSVPVLFVSNPEGKVSKYANVSSIKEVINTL